MRGRVRCGTAEMNEKDTDDEGGGLAADGLLRSWAMKGMMYSAGVNLL
jgi:hypothetical protein